MTPAALAAAHHESTHLTRSRMRDACSRLLTRRDARVRDTRKVPNAHRSNDEITTQQPRKRETIPWNSRTPPPPPPLKTFYQSVDHESHAEARTRHTRVSACCPATRVPLCITYVYVVRTLHYMSHQCIHYFSSSPTVCSLGPLCSRPFLNPCAQR